MTDSSKSETFEQALTAVANADKNPRFAIGEPVWVPHDPRCFIVVGLHKPMFGAWRYDLVLETDPTGPLYLALEHCLADRPPPNEDMHVQHQGKMFLTATGLPIKCIRHPLDQARAP
jgi:hypothetical protein